MAVIGSNWHVMRRKALYTANKPFSPPDRDTDSSLWWSIVEDVRTWLLNSRDAFIPKLRATSSITMTRKKRTA